MIEIIEACTSTNEVLSLIPEASHGLLLAARTQTAGRGQRGNKWESEPGRNITFSLMLRPRSLRAARQFELSMIVSLAIKDVLDGVLSRAGSPERIAVKWPNDIYIGDRKVCGILIENALEGAMISRSIVGAGINVNQRRFVSDAPNPASLVDYTGGDDLDLDEILRALDGAIAPALDAYEAAPDPEGLKRRYMAALWRGRGEWPFREPGGEVFTASIADVGLDGMLTLSTGKSYAFKEIISVL